MTESEQDRRFMAEALQLAQRGLYGTDPNPRVGCLLVRQGAVVGQGWHHRAGEPHAEVEALRMAGAAARGATAYVTLEPCNHHGRTPPCSEALIAAGVARVVAAMEDPNPRVAGGGLAALRRAGIAVECGLLAEAAAALNPGFIRRMGGGRPLLRLKLAMSLDGRTALHNGVSQWITGPAARADVQRLRARSSAILTGSGTVLADDPALTVRDLDALGEWAERPLRQPLRVVVDSQLRTPPGARLLHEAGETLIFTRQPLDEARAAQLRDRAHVRIEAIAVTTGQGVDLDAVLQRLAALQCNELLAECGPRLAGNLVQQGLVDELWIYLAPLLLGSAARPLLQLPAIERMADRWPLLIDEIRPLGDDWRIRARFDHAAHATKE